MADGDGVEEVRAAPPVRSGLIDPGRMAELKEEIGEEEFQEVVSLFLEEADAMVDAMAGAPPETLERELHALKGASLNLGFAALAAACAEGERIAGQGRAETVVLTGIFRCYASSRAELLSMTQGTA